MWPAFGQSARSSVLPGGLPNQSANRLIRIGKEFSKLPRNPVTFLPFVAACSQQSRFPLLQFQVTVQIFLLLIKNKVFGPRFISSGNKSVTKESSSAYIIVPYWLQISRHASRYWSRSSAVRHGWLMAIRLTPAFTISLKQSITPN